MDGLYDYIAADNIVAASETGERLFASIDALERHPEMGREGRVAGTRELVVPPYVVAYSLTGDVIEILAILHGARKWPDSF